MRTVSRALVWIALALMACTARAGGYDAGAWQRDYAQLKQALEQDYANLAWFESPEGGVHLPRLDRLTRPVRRWASCPPPASPSRCPWKHCRPSG
ncbi:hypothetical protein [Aquabacterium sp.]|uniref:hypothetical protein n=1 Tax=Aquabacterium sp. TaxID=1872578 RepID=UPI003784FCB7